MEQLLLPSLTQSAPEKECLSGRTQDAACRLAQIIRIGSAPPFMVAVLLLLLHGTGQPGFDQPSALLCGFLFLCIVPLLAYPAARLIPALRKQGREGERKTAFLFSALSYGSGWIVSFVMQNRPLLLLFTIYTLSVGLLLLWNKGFGVRASGHGCSVVGPLALSALYLGWWTLLPGAVVYAAIFWSSRRLGRHTAREFLLGSGLCLLAMVLSAGIFFLLGLFPFE